MSKYLFLNGSMNKDGRTARMAARLLDGKSYDTLNLVDMKIAQLGQSKEGDQFQETMNALKAADTVVIGSPVYWYTMGGLLKTWVDRLYELQGSDPGLGGKRMVFIFQGSAPSKMAIESTSYIFERIAGLMGMEFLGTITTESEIGAVAARLN